MLYKDLRNTLREWFRAQVLTVPALDALPLVVPNQDADFGTERFWLRYSLQTGDATVIAVGTAKRMSRRVGRVYVEVFGPKSEGEGEVSELASAIEVLFRAAIPGDSGVRPHQLITINEPSTFERPEAERYCQVVSVPVQIDHFT